jgi:phosphate transport system permease protein
VSPNGGTISRSLQSSLPSSTPASSAEDAQVANGRLNLRPPPRWHGAAEVALKLMAFSAIAAVALIFIFIAKEALPLLWSDEVHKEVTLGKMWTAQLWPGYDEAGHVWQPVSDIPKFGVWPLLIGSLKVTFVAMLAGVPLAVGAALYVSQFARPRVREVVKPAIEMLAAIPSVVLGFFALIVMATMLQDWFGLESRLNAVVAGLALSFAVIPVVFTISEEAFRAVPPSFVEASTALGAARWQTVVRVVLPAASPGIAAGVALGLGRAVGETMIVLMASGNAAVANLDLLDSVRTIPATIAAELAEVVFGGGHYTVLFFLGALLFTITGVVNFSGDLVIQRMKRKLGVAA